MRPLLLRRPTSTPGPGASRPVTGSGSSLASPGAVAQKATVARSRPSTASTVPTKARLSAACPWPPPYPPAQNPLFGFFPAAAGYLAPRHGGPAGPAIHQRHCRVGGTAAAGVPRVPHPGVTAAGEQCGSSGGSGGEPPQCRRRRQLQLPELGLKGMTPWPPLPLCPGPFCLARCAAGQNRSACFPPTLQGPKESALRGGAAGSYAARSHQSPRKGPAGTAAAAAAAAPAPASPLGMGIRPVSAGASHRSPPLTKPRASGSGVTPQALEETFRSEASQPDPLTGIEEIAGAPEATIRLQRARIRALEAEVQEVLR